jgi:hypothetical protein
MNLVYKLWVYYYAFIKSVYTKRWKDMNSSVFALAVSSLFVYLMFLMIAVEIIFDIKGFLSLFQRGLPVGPIFMGVSFVLLFILAAILSKINIKNKFLIKRNTVAKFKNKSKFKVKLYLIICSIVFFLILVLSVFNAIGK